MNQDTAKRFTRTLLALGMGYLALAYDNVWCAIASGLAICLLL